jgi:hypothetical protein
VQKGNYVISGSFDIVKNHLSKFVQFAFLDAQYAENEFAWLSTPFKHRFSNFTKVVF